MDTIINIICSLPAVLAAFTIHEYAHAKTADALGDPTPRMTGRVTLDPFAHIDWIGLICLLVADFGWGKPVRVNSSYFKKPRRDSVLVAVAGPLSNLMLALLSGVVYVILLRFYIRMGAAGEVLMRIVLPFVSWNTLLFAFNIIPVPPLDGYKVIKGFSKHPSNSFFRFMDKYGTLVLMVLFMTGMTSRFISLISSIVNLPMMTLAGLVLHY